MRILFDQGTPAPLREFLQEHEVQTLFELGCSEYSNGELLALAEQSFDLLVTTDQQLKYQQKLAGRNLRIAVLMTTSWPRIRSHIDSVVARINQIPAGEYHEITFP
jgi:predicted nuclease of predicted toxin-antitoxin system